MDWIQTLVIIGIFSGFFIYMLSKLDRIDKEMANQGKELREDISKLDKKISHIEARLEFSNKVVYVQHDELKEN